MKKLIYLITLMLAFTMTSCYAEASVCDDIYDTSVTVTVEDYDGVDVYFTYYYDPEFPHYYWRWDFETSMWRWYYFVTPPTYWRYWPGERFFGGPIPYWHVDGRPHFRPGPHHRPHYGRPNHGGHHNFGGYGGGPNHRPHNGGPGHGGGVAPRPNHGKPNGGFNPRPGGGRPNGGYRPGSGGGRPGGGYHHNPGGRPGGGFHGGGGGGTAPRHGGKR